MYLDVWELIMLEQEYENLWTIILCYRDYSKHGTSEFRNDGEMMIHTNTLQYFVFCVVFNVSDLLRLQETHFLKHIFVVKANVTAQL